MTLKLVQALEWATSEDEIIGTLRTIVWYTNKNINEDPMVGSYYRNELVRVGGLKAMIQTMKKYKHVVEIQNAACQGLFNLAYENDKVRVLIVQLGGIGTILGAMETHLDKEEIQYHGLQALWRLSFHCSVRRMVVESGGTEVVQRAVAVHATSHRNIQFWGRLALRHLEAPPKYHKSYNEYSDDVREIPEWVIDLLFVLVMLVLLCFAC
mmetsp:Transcript_983/g.1532  ORF Transcript_983/g.1532 Transcript_983/m.1532 type:complete len:210 (+) Transcript_983:215-844(+)